MSENAWFWKVSETILFGKCQKLFDLESVTNCLVWRMSELESVRIGKGQELFAFESARIEKCHRLFGLESIRIGNRDKLLKLESARSELKRVRNYSPSVTFAHLSCFFRELAKVIVRNSMIRIELTQNIIFTALILSWGW